MSEVDVIRPLTMWMDNDPQSEYFNRLAEVAQNAVRDDMGTGMGRDAFERMLRGQGGDREDYVRVVGIAVAAEIQEILAEDAGEYTDSLCYKILIDILDLSSSSMKDALGEHYLPEKVDDIEWDEEDTEEEEEDIDD